MIPSRAQANGGVGICDRPTCHDVRDDRLNGRQRPAAPAAAAAPRPAAQRATRRSEAEAAQLDRLADGRSALLLNLLDRSHTPRAPRALMAGEKIPAEMTKMMPPAPIVDLVHVPISYSYQRPYTGPVEVLDRTAAWVAAISTVEVAHGYRGWQHTGAVELPPAGPILPGYYEVRIAAWYETDMPSPLAATKHVPVGGTVWVAEPLARLLRDLAEAGRWGGGSLDIVDSYTHPVRVRLDQWANAIRDIRAKAIQEFGFDAPQYKSVKLSYARAVQTMHGEAKPGGPRAYTPSGIHRDDITAAVKTMMAVTVWRNADAINRLAPDKVIAIRNTDEIHITPDALYAISIGPHTAGRPKIDVSGLTIGTYKIKRVEA